MILIADGGSTKTDWCVVDQNQLIQQIFTPGINPFFQTEEEISREIEMTLLPQLMTHKFDSIHFYGAGCVFADKIETVTRALAANLEVSGTIEVNTDMLAAARGLCGREKGIVCILGTGSNSCFYDGEQIIDNVSPLGFILGDEGSGAVLGKLLVGDLLKNQLPEGLKEKFLEQFDLTPAAIIDSVYRQPFPNRFLAGLSRFVLQHVDEPHIYSLALKSFRSFLERNVKQYDYQQVSVHFIGSIAYNYKEILTAAIVAEEVTLGTIIKSPMDGLIEYHKNETAV